MKGKFSTSCDISKNLKNKVRAANFKCGRIKDELISFSREGMGLGHARQDKFKKKGGDAKPPPSPSTVRFLHYDREAVVANEGLVIIHYQGEGGGGGREVRGVLRITWFSGGDEGGSDVSNRFYMGGDSKILTATWGESFEYYRALWG